MKKLSKLIMMSMLVLSLVACSGGEKKEESLVIYTPAPEDKINKTIPVFEEETGIKVELVPASTGELFSRIKNEADNPIADVIWSGARFNTMKDYFEPYESKNIENIPEEYRVEGNYYTPEALGGPVLLVNTNLIEKGSIKGYKDLLNPEYKGMIAHGDVSSSSSAASHITNMLFAINPEDPMSEASWDFVKAFLENLDGKIVNSSGAIQQGVASGEYAIGLSFEEAGLQNLAADAPVEVVYMEEGVVFTPSDSAIIKNAPNMENAKRFIDFLASKEGQNITGLETTARPIMADAELSDIKKPISEINVIHKDRDWDDQNMKDVQEKYVEILTSLH